MSPVGWPHVVQAWVFRNPTPMHTELGTGSTYRAVTKVPAADTLSPFALPTAKIAVTEVLPRLNS